MPITLAELAPLAALNMRPRGAFEPVTPNDSVDLLIPCIGLNVAGAGTVSITDLRGETLTVFCTAGWNPVPCRRVRATGTTATGIVAVY